MNKNAAFALFVVIIMALWNVLDCLYATFITHSGYQFDVGTDLIIPLAVALVSGYLFFLRKK